MADSLTYAWSSNGGGVFANAALKDTTWTAPDVTQETAVVLTLLVTDSGGLTDTDSVSVTVRAAVTTAPDLTVDTPSIFGGVQTLTPGQSFSLSATVRNGGDADSTATTLRWRRSTNDIISTSDLQVGTDAVGVIAPFGVMVETITLNAPTAPGTYYYGTTVDSIANESDTSNNASGALTLVVAAAATTTHTVNAGDISWAFAVPQAAVTHVSPSVQLPGTPGTPTVTARTATSISLSTTSGGGGAATLYRWRYSTNATVSNSDPMVTSTGRTVTITGLAADDDYWVDVRAENSAGNSAYSGDRATSTTAQPQPPGTPTNLQVGTRTTTTIALSVSPGSGGTPTQYRWRLSTNNFMSDSDTVLNTSGTTATFTGLSAGTSYWVDVRAENDDGNSSYNPSGSTGLETSTLSAGTSADHAVNAGDVAWSFNIPQASVTHVSPSVPDSLTYAWSSNGGGVFANDALKDTSWTAPDVSQETVVTLTLLVTDSGGLTDTDSVDVTVRAPTPGVAHAVNAGGVSWAFALPEPTISYNIIRLDSLNALDAVFRRQDTGTQNGAWQQDSGGSTGSTGTGPGTNSAGSYVHSESTSGVAPDIPLTSTITALASVMSAWVGNGRVLALRACIQGNGTYPNDSASGLQIQGRATNSDFWATIELLEGWAYSNTLTPGDTVMDSLGVTKTIVQAGGWVDFEVTIPDAHRQLRIRNIPITGSTTATNYLHDAALWHMALRDGTTPAVAHAVDAGDVVWAFAVPQPSVTHVPRPAVAYAVNAGDVTWAFAVPQPTITHTVGHTVDAGDVSWVFALPQPSVTHTAATVPDQPTGLVATVTHAAVSLAWNDPGDASITSYQILRRDITGGGSLGVHIDSVPTGTSYVDSTNVASSNSYSYRIKARNAQGLSAQSAFRNVTTSAAPLTPINHTVDAGDVSWSFAIPQVSVTHVTPTTADHTVNAGDVSWAFAVPQVSVTSAVAFSVELTLTQTATENVYTWTNPDSYILDFVCADDDPIVPLSGYSSVRSSIPASLLTLTYTRPAGAPYYALRLVSTDQFSNTVGPADNVASGDHTVDAGGVSWAFALPQPSVTHVSADFLTYLWSSNGGGVFADAGLKDTTWTAPDVTQETAVVLSLLVTDSGGLTDTDSVAITVREPATVPDAPTGLAATATHNTVSLTWADPNDSSITSYQILRRDISGSGSLGVHVDSVPAGTGYDDTTNVDASNLYSYRIKARNPQGLSAQSGFVNTTTRAAPVAHTVDAGDVTWAFAVPVVGVTHVTPTTGAHTVDAGDVSWSFAIPQVSVTHVTPTTTAHTVNAGGVSWSFNIPQASVTHVSASMADSLTYAWSSNGGGVFANAALKDTTWTAPDVTQETAVVLTLLVTDSGGLTDTDSVSVTVREPAVPGTVNAGGVSWAFAIPQAAVTHVSAGTMAHAVRAGDVSWAFVVSQPTVAHVKALIAGAGAVVTLEIDWGNDGTFSHAAADVTDDLVRHSLRTTRGRTLQSRRKATAGRLEAKLWNLAAKYDPFNSSSPIYQRDISGLRVRVLLAGVPAWGGILDSIRYRNRPVPQVDIIALGLLSTLRQPVSVAGQTSSAIGTIAKLVGDAIGITTSYLTGGKSLDRWKGVTDQDALTVLHDLEETEEGFLSERADGELQLEAENARSTGVSATSALTLKGDVEAVGDIPILRGSGLDWGYRQIANVVYVPVETLEDQAEAILWRVPNDIDVGAGRTVTVIIAYPNANSPSNARGVEAWVAPVSGTDYTPITGLTVSGAVVGDRYQLTLQNTSSATITVAKNDIAVRGRALTAGALVWVKADDSASIATFGEREYARPSPLFTTIAAAQEYADGIVSRQKSPHGWLVARWPAYYAVEQARGLDVSRRITVERLGEIADYYIEGISLAMRSFVRMEYLLSPVPGVNIPSAPVVTLAQVGGQAEQLAVAWTEPFDGGSAITGYDIRYKKSVDTTWTSWSHTGTGRTATIMGLDQGGISYDVQVRATNVQGSSLWSVNRIGMTPNQGPDAPAAPTLIGAVGSLGVSWVAPYDGGRVLTGYDVAVQKEHG